MDMSYSKLVPRSSAYSIPQDVKKDEDEFRKMQEAERIKQAKAKKVQENVNRTREQNARRKLDKVASSTYSIHSVENPSRDLLDWKQGMGLWKTKWKLERLKACWRGRTGSPGCLIRVRIQRSAGWKGTQEGKRWRHHLRSRPNSYSCYRTDYQR